MAEKKGPKKRSVESLMEAFEIDRAGAEALLAQATEYHNAGKGVVLRNESTADRVADLFGQRELWLSAELNKLVGWQFSQAVRVLRERGWHIKTLNIMGRIYAYKWVGMGNPLKKKREATA